jgi:hypothetical protein
MTETSQNYINHIALVLDASGSMMRHKGALIKVADQQIEYLAQRSKELEQETRVTIYTFDDEVKCLVYDKDVLRLPSIKTLYRTGGMTALIDATLRSQDDLAHTWEGYGDHSFLTFVLTDGLENASGRTGGYFREDRVLLAKRLANRLENLPDHWTVAVLVPDQMAKREAMSFGFPKDNIAIWDANSSDGVEEAVSTIRTATDTYMTNRTRGVRGSRSLFVGGNVDAKAIKAANLTPLPTADRKIVVVAKTRDTESLFFEKPVNRATKKRPVPDKAWHVEIKPFVDAAYPPYRVGMAYYELTKSERVTGDKQIAVVDVNDNQVYVGDGARQLLGLPTGQCRVKPTLNPSYKIFVESTSLNRHLKVGTQLLLLTK